MVNGWTSDNWISVLRIVEMQEEESREDKDGQIYWYTLLSIATAARSVSRLAPLVRFQARVAASVGDAPQDIPWPACLGGWI